MLRLIALTLTLIALAACAAGPGQVTPPRTEPVAVEEVQVEILESDPVQVVAVIKGGLGSGCLSLGEITQRRDGNTVEVTMLANHSGAEACTMIYQLVDERVPLEGPFAPGDYTLIVNGVERAFSV
jgi:hypothetical protein